jgi:cardiolipin synthase
VSRTKERKLFLFVSLLSGVRIPLALCFLFLITSRHIESNAISLLILIILLITDSIDGILARKWRVTSKFGYVLDGVADRASYLACLLAIGQEPYFPDAILYLIVLRDLLLYASRSVIAGWYAVSQRSRLTTKLNALSLRLVLGLGLALVYWRAFEPEGHWLVRVYWEGLVIFLAVIYTTVAYLLLAQLVRLYAAADRTSRGPSSALDQTGKKGEQW